MIESRSTVPVCFVIGILALPLLQSCSLSGIRRVEFVDEKSKHLNDVLVVPLSRATKFGRVKSVAWEPFLYQSGDNLLKKPLQKRGVVVAPGFFIGDEKSIHSWLFMKRSYKPTVMRNGTLESGSVPCPEGGFRRTKPIILESAPPQVFTDALDTLLSPSRNRDKLNALLGSNYDVVFTEENRELLRSLR